MIAPPSSIAILGNDAFLAASPAHPVQFMHAALLAGFDATVPASLGDELVAGEVLRLAQLRGRQPVVQCSCPFALSQLCKREANLADVTVAVAPAAVALARALRQQQSGGGTLHITYIGGCPGAQDPAIDLQVKPQAFLRGLEQKGIVLNEQPDAFADRLPADRRRFLSLPGGAPRTEHITAVLRRNVITLTDRTHPMLAIADALFDGGVTMIDPAGAYRCVCAGASEEVSVASGRVAIEQLEPRRASSPIFDAPPWLDLRPTAVIAASEPSREYERPPESMLRFDGNANPVSDAAGAAAPVAGAPSTSSDASRRLYALGVRTARRRGAGAATSVSKIVSSEPEPSLPTTSSALRAPSMDRETPIIPAREGLREYLTRDQGAEEPQRTPTFDELLRRD